MTIIVFLIDTSASMLQRTYMGTSYLDYARLAVEQFLKQRQRDPASNGDRYMLMTFEEYPQNIKSGWKENQRVFNEQLKSLKARGSLGFDAALESVLRLLMVSRMQSGTGANIETYGYGRFITYSEHVVIIPVVDGSSLPAASPETRVPKPRLLTGSDLFTDGFRWDHRCYPIVLRLPGQLHFTASASSSALSSTSSLPQQQQGSVPPEDASIARNIAEQMGGRSFALTSHRSLAACIDQIIQRIQTNGVLIRFQKHGPDPPPPAASSSAENDQQQQQRGVEDADAWKNSLVLVKSKLGQQHSHWPVPEAYWPDSVRNVLPPRQAHPTIAFKCERAEMLVNTEFPWDKYELDTASPLAQHILARKETNLCWQVFVENSYKQSGLGFPFGYIKVSTASTVTLYIMPYNYPELLSLLSMSKDNREQRLAHNVQFQKRFEHYLQTVPAYYYSALRKALNRLKVVPSALEDANIRLYPYCNLPTLQTRIKHQGQHEFDVACSAVTKNLQEASLNQNSAVLVKVSRSRTQLGKAALTECRFRPAVAAYKAAIPADTFKELSVFLLEQQASQTQQVPVPSLQFKNPFDIPRTLLCSQLDKMRLNFDQQVETSNLHVLQGGMPGQKIKLQHAEDLHNLPINKMGIYEDYIKSLHAIGLAPKRELEAQAARPHAFGNPFKLDKKNISTVDEVGEEGNGGDPESSSSTSNSSTSSSSNERGASNRKRGERATSEPLGASSSKKTEPRRPKRRPGPLDPNRLALWKAKRRRRSSGASESIASDASEFDVQSAPDELGMLEDLDEEEQEEEEKQEKEQPDEDEEREKEWEKEEDEEEKEEKDEEEQRKKRRIYDDDEDEEGKMEEEEAKAKMDEEKMDKKAEENMMDDEEEEKMNVEEKKKKEEEKHRKRREFASRTTTASSSSLHCLPSTSSAPLPSSSSTTSSSATSSISSTSTSSSASISSSSSSSVAAVVKKKKQLKQQQQREHPPSGNNTSNRSQQNQQLRRRTRIVLRGQKRHEFLHKQRQVRKICRQINPNIDSIHAQLMDVVCSDHTLTRDQRRSLLELAQRELRGFRRQKLTKLVGKELQQLTTGTNNKNNNNKVVVVATNNHNHR